ncbi:MAG: type II toxin-antitoxin system PemK/MazF family toxin [Sulfuricaulis sp.]
MEIKRGNVVLCTAAGDYGKPRPAIVVQSDLFNPTHPSITLCPITSDIQPATLFRLGLIPSSGNGLKKRSQVMVDKITSLPPKRIGKVIGNLPSTQIRHIDTSLKLWLGLS